MKALSSLLEGVLGADDGLKLYISIARSWQYVVGEDLVGLTKLGSLRCLPDGRYVVYVHVIGAYSIVAKSREGAMLERIESIMRGKKVSAIVFKHCSEIEKPMNNAA